MHKETLPLFLKTDSFIAGDWMSSGETFSVINPSTKEIICDVSDTSINMLEIAIDKSFIAQKLWANLLTSERAEILLRWHDLIIQHKDELAKLLTLEQGKPLTESYAEIGNAETVRWAVEESYRVYGHIIPSFKQGTRAEIIYQPVGVVAAITPWNFPHSMITRKVSPALAAGCAVILKPAEDTPLCALALAVLAQQAGIPKGVLSIIPCSRKNVTIIGDRLLSDKKIRKLSFTGSTAVGKTLMEKASKTVKNISLELGGNAPFLIFASANLDKAVEALIGAKFRNAGQTCICANRIFVERKIINVLKEKLIERIKQFKIGDGLTDGINFSSVINQAAFDKINSITKDAKFKNAIITDIGVAPDNGYFIVPKIIENITSDMRIAHEEIFGPLLALYPFDSEDEVIKEANSTEYGLAAYVHSGDMAQASRVAKALDVGMVAVNEPSFVHSTLPFGGMKESGIGREGGFGCLKEFLEVKTIVFGLF
jgi:succinate-semialdehyde dehydrogenase/glutarate-semialdehyde dehydrogenase